MQQLRLLLIVFFFTFFQNVTNAQTDSSQLDPVTVTSTINPMNASKTGRNIFVINGERFFALPINSVDELLRYLPGLEVQSRGAMGAQSDIVIRGGTFQQVLVILDGIRLNDPVTGHFNSYIPIAPAEISHIEILKGASSAVYGSEAVGGVVHIITKTFAAKSGTKQKAFNAQVGTGTYNLLNVHGGGFYNDGTTAFGGGLLTNNTTGQPQRGTKGYFNNHTASFSFNRFINKRTKISLRSAYDSRRFSAQNFYTTFASDTAKERVQTAWNHFNITHQKTGSKTSFDAGFKTSDDRFAFNPKSAPNLNKSKLWQALLQNEQRLNKNVSLNTGLQFLNKSIRSNDRGKHSESQAAVFALLHFNSEQGFTFSPALRLDWQEQRGLEAIPQAALSYRFKKWLLRSSGGKTIRDADFTERYNNYGKTLVTGGRIGNPELQAETAVNFELGADYFLNKNWKLSGTFFQRFHKGLIDYVTTPYAQMPRKENLAPTGTFALAKNIAAVDIAGIETDLQYNYKIGRGSNLWGSVGFIWLDASSKEGASAFYLSSFAKFLSNFSVVYAAPRFSISTTGLYKARKAQTASAINASLSKNYFVLNAKAEVFPFKNKAGLFVQTDNIFDTQYSDLLGAQMPGRWLQFGLRFSL